MTGASIVDIHGYPLRKGVLMDAVLSKWGNSKALRLPSEVCGRLGVDVGSVARVTVDDAERSVTFSFDQPRQLYTRAKRMTMREFADGWQGGKVGEEWGGADVGAEVVE